MRDTDHLHEPELQDAIGWVPTWCATVLAATQLAFTTRAPRMPEEFALLPTGDDPRGMAQPIHLRAAVYQQTGDDEIRADTVRNGWNLAQVPCISSRSGLKPSEMDGNSVEGLVRIQRLFSVYYTA